MTLTKERLSARDAEIYALLMKGLSTNAIVDKLNLTRTGVGDALKRIFRKCGVKTRYQLLAIGGEMKLPKGGK